jgi:hypothetical protein
MPERLLALILSAVPARVAALPQPHALVETVAEREDRMRSIAADVWAVASTEQPLEGYTRAGTALFMLAVSRVETDYALDADVGPCGPGRCDGGRAFGLLQVHPLDGEDVSTRQAALRTGLRHLRWSLKMCPGEGALVQYAGGVDCADEEKLAKSRRRMAEVRIWLERWRR